MNICNNKLILSNNYNKDTYNTYWRGIEDVRFINEDTLLAIVPELNINGNPSIFISSFNSINSEIHSFI